MPVDICPGCHQAVLDGDLLEKIVGNERYHLKCFNCTSCGEYLSDKFFKASTGDGLLCEGCASNLRVSPSADAPALPAAPTLNAEEGNGSPKKRVMGPRGYMLVRPNIETQGSSCVKCGKTVFDAEKMRAFSGDYHRSCFKCARCDVILGSVEKAHSIQAKPHCVKCYKELELGVRYSGGANKSASAAPQEYTPGQTFPVTELQGNREKLTKAGLDVTRLEDYLSAEDFQTVFSMNRKAFTALPKWKQVNLKKAVRLF